MSDEIKWQNKIFPFAVIFIIVLLIVFSLFYIYQIANIEAYSTTSVYDARILDSYFEKGSSIAENKQFTLELISLLNRHRSASLVVKSRILIIGLTFLTGVIMSFLGSIFILGKFSNNTTANGEFQAAKIAFTSSSPGIVLSLLGVILISICILSKASFVVEDNPSYINTSKTYTIKTSEIDSLAQMTLDTTRAK